MPATGTGATRIRIDVPVCCVTRIWTPACATFTPTVVNGQDGPVEDAAAFEVGNPQMHVIDQSARVVGGHGILEGEVDLP